MMRSTISRIFFSFGCRATCSSNDFVTMPFSTHRLRIASGNHAE